MPRKKLHAVRNALGEIYASIPFEDRSKIAEWERDLITTANCALWDHRTRKVASCVRRLFLGPTQRSQAYGKVWELLAENTSALNWA